MTYHFQHKYIEGDFDNGSCSFEDENKDLVKAAGDLIIGCDGAYSSVRKNLMRKVRMDFSQVKMIG